MQHRKSKNSDRYEEYSKYSKHGRASTSGVGTSSIPVTKGCVLSHTRRRSARNPHKATLTDGKWVAAFCRIWFPLPIGMFSSCSVAPQKAEITAISSQTRPPTTNCLSARLSVSKPVDRRRISWKESVLERSGIFAQMWRMCGPWSAISKALAKVSHCSRVFRCTIANSHGRVRACR